MNDFLIYMSSLFLGKKGRRGREGGREGGTEGGRRTCAWSTAMRRSFSLASAFSDAICASILK